MRQPLQRWTLPRSGRLEGIPEFFSIMTVMSQRESTLAPPAGFSPQILARLAELETALGSAIRGKAEVVRLSLVCLLARGHLLIEDVPGVGKATLGPGRLR